MARRTPPPTLIGSGLIPENFQNQYAAAEDDYQSGLAGLSREERNLYRDYGFQGGIGESGTVNFEVDPTAPYGQYQSLLRNIGGQLGQARQEVKGRGLGRSGLARARENLIRFMMSGAKADLTTGFTKQAADIFGKRGIALTGRNRRFGELEGQALDWWNQYGPDDPDGSLPAPQPETPRQPQSWPGAGGYVGQLPPEQVAWQYADPDYAGPQAIQYGDADYGVNQGMTADPNWPDQADPYAPITKKKKQNAWSGGGGTYQAL